MKLIASFSVTPDPRYVFPAVIAARLWQRINVVPLVWAMGKPARWREHPALSVALKEFDETSNRASMFVPSRPDKQDPKWEAVYVRQLAGMLTRWFEEYDFCLLSDADLWPLNAHYINDPFERTECSIHGAIAWYANAYNCMGGGWYPACHVGMSIALWRKVNDFAHCHLHEDALHELIHRSAKPGDPYKPFVNEQYMAARLRELGIDVLQVNRPEIGACMPAGRLDRSKWRTPTSADMDKLVDAHVPLDLWESDKWCVAEAVLRDRMGREFASWAKGYRDSFAAAMEHAPVAEGVSP